MLNFYLAVVVFFSFTWLFEYLYGLKTGKNTYNGNEFLSNISMGLTSTLVSVCITLISVPLYIWIYENASLSFLKNAVVAQIIVAVIAYDFLYYWNHRWHHTISFLWLGHSVHHSGQTFNYSTSLRLGVIASATSWVVFMPLAMLGVSVEVYFGIYAVQLFYQHLIHTRHIPKLGILEKFFYTPSHHRVHHASNKEYIDKNHGCFTIIFDKLFNTYAEERDDIKTVYGTTHVVTSHVPSNVNFFELNRLIQYLGRKARPIKQWLSALFGGPDYDEQDNTAHLPRPALADYSHNVTKYVTALFLSALFLALYIAINFLNKAQTLDFLSLMSFVILVIGIIDIGALHLNQSPATYRSLIYALVLSILAFFLWQQQQLNITIFAFVLVFLAVHTLILFYKKRPSTHSFEGINYDK